MTGSGWVSDARRALLAAQRADGGWGYRRASPSHAEPTAVAGLALLATGGHARTLQADAVRAAADRLAALQNADGSVAASADLPDAGWATPFAILLWEAAGRHAGRAEAASRWLCGRKGLTMPRDLSAASAGGHDTTIVGWPWVDGTHSWVEPTAAAVLALGRRGPDGPERVREGVRLLRDRALPAGGWNYGNKALFGHPLRPQPGPTGLALLALAGGPPADGDVTHALDYLARALPETRAPQSLGWGVLGLRAWGAPAGSADGWLADASAKLDGRDDAAPRLAMLLLAAGPDALGLFGRARPATTPDGTNP